MYSADTQNSKLNAKFYFICIIISGDILVLVIKNMIVIKWK